MHRVIDFEYSSDRCGESLYNCSYFDWIYSQRVAILKKFKNKVSATMQLEPSFEKLMFWKIHELSFGCLSSQCKFAVFERLEWEVVDLCEQFCHYDSSTTNPHQKWFVFINCWPIFGIILKNGKFSFLCAKWNKQIHKFGLMFLQAYTNCLDT